MKRLLCIFLLSHLTLASAQPLASECEQGATAKLNAMWSVTVSTGNQTYTKLMDRALACIQGGRCSKPEALINIQEIMIDDQIIEMQRQKVALMKRYFAQTSPSTDACAIAKIIPPLIQELNAPHAKQLSRFEELSSQFYASRRAQ